MRNLRITIVFLAIEMLSFGQNLNFAIKEIQSSLAKIDDSLYASKFEVTNKQYSSFLNFLTQNNNSESYRIAQIDSLKWRNKSAHNEPYVKYYHTHSAYANYPVVNISYEGALLYCEWLTSQYNSNIKRKFKKVKFRLPSELEWTTAAKGGDPMSNYPWEEVDFKTDKDLFRCNFKRDASDSAGINKNSFNADVIAPSKSYKPNKYGLYNMSGNVAEMLSEKGQTKGGCWQDESDAMKIDSKGIYASFNTPMPTIGFRYFMEIIEK